ncbi:MAG: hypothetical protein GX434_16230 [Peptococcaceae bacterium]|nr:hypothetical protein [Peptococcaceae bacterium]
MDRLAGDDRYGTAVAISQAGWSSAPSVILTSGNDANLVDALTSAPLAKAKGAPILFTGSERLNPQTEAEITRLGATDVYITSGQEVIPDSELNGLTSRGIAIHRLGGSDRYETSLNIAREFQTASPITGIALTNAFSSADSLSIAPIAASLGIPIILTAPDSIPSRVSAFLASTNPRNTFVIGGTGVIAGNLESALPNPTRLGGTDRYDTNRIVVEAFKESVRSDTIYIANGNDGHLVDSLAGSSLAAAMGCQIILSEQNILPSGTADYINSTLDVNNVVLLGGQAVIDQAVADAITPQTTNTGNTGNAGNSGGSSGGDDSPALSSAKAITQFRFAGLSPAINGTITEATHTITALVPAGTDLTALVPTITVSAKATVSPSSGAATNFTGPVTYTVTAENGTTQTYTVTVSVPPAPTITSFTPNTGTPYNGGTEVTITGTNLATTTGVKFGALDAASFTVNSNTQIKAVVPAAGTGTVAITVATLAGSVTSADTFTYDLTRFTAVNTLNTDAGTARTISLSNIYGPTGTRMTSGTVVNVKVTSTNVLEGTSGVLIDSQPYTATTIRGLGVGVTLSLTLNQTGSQTLTISLDGHAFSLKVSTSVYNPPTIAGVSPTTALYAGGTQVTITGNHLSDVTGVTIANTAATINSKSDTAIVVTTSLAPLPLQTGKVILNRNISGLSTVTSTDDFTYTAVPAARVEAQVALIGGANKSVTNVPVVYNVYDDHDQLLPYGGVFPSLWTTDVTTNGTFLVNGTPYLNVWRPYAADGTGHFTVVYSSGTRGVSDDGFEYLWVSPVANDSKAVKSEYHYNNLPPASVTAASATLGGSGQAVFTVLTTGGARSKYNVVYARLVSSAATGGKATWSNGLSQTTLENGGGYVPVIADSTGKIVLDYVKGSGSAGTTDTIYVALDAAGTGAQTITCTY